MSHRVHSAGKGDSYRPVDRKKYSENYDRIFGQKQEQAMAKDIRGKAEFDLKALEALKGVSGGGIIPLKVTEANGHVYSLEIGGEYDGLKALIESYDPNAFAVKAEKKETK